MSDAEDSFVDLSVCVPRDLLGLPPSAQGLGGEASDAACASGDDNAWSARAACGETVGGELRKRGAWLFVC